MKPIFIIRVGFLPESQELADEIRNKLSCDIKEDYHVIVLFENRMFGEQEVRFEMFSDKEIEPIKLEELMSKVK